MTSHELANQLLRFKDNPMVFVDLPEGFACSSLTVNSVQLNISQNPEDDILVLKVSDSDPED